MSKRKRGAKETTVAVDEAEADSALSHSAAAAAASSSAATAAAPSAAIPATKATKAAKPPKPHPSQALYANTRHWLMKNEPPFSLAALRDLPNQREPWVGVRNHQAKCMMVHGMKRGHRVLYYNASVANPHIAGLATVASDQAYADHTAFDKSSCYFDPKSDPAAPTWFMVDVAYEREFSRPLYLAELRLHDTGSNNKASADKEEEEDEEQEAAEPADAAAPPLSRTVSAPTASASSAAAAAASPLSNFTLFTRRRLSIHPLTASQFEFLCSLEGQPLPASVKLKPEKKKGTSAAPAAAAAAAEAADGAASTQAAEKQKQPTKPAAAAMNDDHDAASAARPTASRSKSVPSAGRNKRAKKS